MMCYVCDKEITDNKYFLTAFDVPYINLYRHATCKELDKDALVEKAKLYAKNHPLSTKKRKI